MPQNQGDVELALAAQAEMARLRGELGDELSGVVEATSSLFSWRSVLNAFPGSILAVAAGLGYLAIPKRTRPHAEWQKETEQIVSKFSQASRTAGRASLWEDLSANVFRQLTAFAVSASLRYVVNRVKSLRRQNPGTYEPELAEKAPRKPR
jgi:hypothetical protein